jgi:hypothetical protein
MYDGFLNKKKTKKIRVVAPTAHPERKRPIARKFTKKQGGPIGKSV